MRAEKRSHRTPIFDRDGSEEGSDAVLTLPNLITVIRLACLPIFLWLLFGNDDRFTAAVLLAIVGATDWVDGYVARALDQHSKLGKVLDPTVDRVFFFVALTSMIIVNAAPVVLLVAILVREAAVGIAAVYLAARGLRTLRVSWLGKSATFGLLIALPLLLAASAHPDGEAAYRIAGWVIVIPSLVASYLSAVGYLPLLAREPRLGDVAGAKNTADFG